MKIVGYISSAILIFFGVLFILGAGGEGGGGWGWVTIGLILVGIAFAIIWFLNRKKPQSGAKGQNVSVNIDLPGEVSLETLVCQSCGGTLTSKNIELASGAPVVVCPYCGTSYQLSEEPKW
jgi:hypothetical protein